MKLQGVPPAREDDGRGLRRTGAISPEYDGYRRVSRHSIGTRDRATIRRINLSTR